MRVLYSCSELGLGHASRTVALGRQLEQRGHEVFFFSGGRAFELLKKEFKNVFTVTPVAWYETSAGVNTAGSLINILFPLPTYDSERDKFGIKNSSAMETIHRYYDLRKRIHEVKPEVVIADGDIHAVRLALRWRIPSVYVTNVIRPSYGFSSILSPGERLTEQYVKKCTRIIIPDNNPPNTVCEYNVGNLDHVGVTEKTEYVGSFFDTKPAEGSQKHIYAPVSGPYGTRSKLMNTLIPAFDELGVKSIISLGIPGELKTAKHGNCTVYTWLPPNERAQTMRDASIVLFSGGHITCFETIKYAKPTVCLPTQPEQLANAAKLQDLHCSLISRNRKQIVHGVREIESNYDSYKKSAEALNEATNKQDGLKRAVEIVEEVKP